jgi:hypothetical protein
MRYHRSSLTRTLITLVTSACMGGTGSGLTGVNGGNGGGGGTTGQARVLEFFSQPGGANAGQIMSVVQVMARDSLGNVDSLFRAQVTLTLASNATGAALNGTRNSAAVRGIASFGNLRIDVPGTYTLRASAAGATDATSTPFTITTVTTP